jgi:hypothetical protein
MLAKSSTSTSHAPTGDKSSVTLTVGAFCDLNHVFIDNDAVD